MIKLNIGPVILNKSAVKIIESASKRDNTDPVKLGWRRSAVITVAGQFILNSHTCSKFLSVLVGRNV